MVSFFSVALAMGHRCGFGLWKDSPKALIFSFGISLITVSFTGKYGDRLWLNELLFKDDIETNNKKTVVANYAAIILGIGITIYALCIFNWH